MRKTIILFSIFFFGLIMFNVQTKIVEPLCKLDKNKPNTQCEKITLEKNKIKSSQLEKKIATILNKINKTEDFIKNNSKSIDSNESNIRKMQAAATGKAIDNSKACAKYPDAC